MPKYIWDYYNDNYQVFGVRLARTWQYRFVLFNIWNPFMVNKYSQLSKRPIFSVAQNKCYSLDRWFEKRFWALYCFSGRVEFRLKKLWHINCLELKAVFLLMKRFLNELLDKLVLIRSDNTSVVEYINRQWVTSSPNLFFLKLEFWKLAIESNIIFKAAHIIGTKIFQRISWTESIPSNTMDMNKYAVRLIFQILGQAFDRSVCFSKKQTEWNLLHLDSQSQFISPGCNDNIMGKHVCICFPLNCLTPRIFQHKMQFRCKIILISPPPNGPGDFGIQIYWNYW